MLDFHIIHDFESTENHSAEAHNHIDGIDYNEFEFWQRNGVLEEYLDYYSDFRLTSDEVEEKINKAMFKVSKSIMPASYRFIDILNKAKAQGAGLMAYAD